MLEVIKSAFQSAFMLKSIILMSFQHNFTKIPAPHYHTHTKSCSRFGLHGEREPFVLNGKKKTFQNCTVQILGIIFKMFACHFGDYKTKEPICKLDGSKGFLYRNLGSKRVSKFHCKEKFL